MKSLERIQKDWLKYQEDTDYHPKLTYPYNQKQDALKSQIQKALVFWAFVRDENSIRLYSRKMFCVEFLADENKFIRLIAHIEQLSDQVWRKLLWSENMDFMGYESFLRRITPDQEASIYEAYEALNLEKPKLPKVFTKSIFEYLRCILNFITPMILKNSNYGERERYYSKGAWAFNLLTMDFGFSLYPNGVDDDQQITNKKFSRFLSIKEHINDFIVNQEDGIYWWLYRAVRSNYVWFPNRNVQLKSHVCPGFWFTLIMHAYFWIVSPVVFYSLMIHAIDVGKFEFTFLNTILAVIFSLTPLWIVLASIKAFMFGLLFLGVVIIDGLKFLFPKLGSILSNFFNPISKFLSKLFIPIAEFFISFFTTVEVKRFVRFIVQNIKYVLYLATGFTIGGALYLAYPYILVAWTFIYHFVSGILSIIASVAINHTSSFLWGTMGILVIIFGSIILFTAGFDEEKYAKRDKLIRRFLRIWFTLFIILGYLTFKNEEMFNYGGYSTYWAVMVNVFSCMVCMLLYSLTMQINMDTIDDRAESKDRASFVVNSLVLVKKDKDRPGMVSKFRKMILSNEWLKKVEHNDYIQILNELKDVAWNNYRFDKDEMSVFLEYVLPKLDKQVFEKLIKPTKVVRGEDRKIKLEFIVMLCQPYNNHSDAVKFIKKTIYRNSNDWKLKMEARERRQVMWNSFKAWCFKRIFTPIIFVLNLIIWPFEKICNLIAAFCSWLWKFTVVLKDLYVLFNERCPYISKSKYLE